MSTRTTPKTAKKAAKPAQTAPQEPIEAPASTPEKAATRPVGRPPLGKQKRTAMCLTVSQEERLALDYISRHQGKSISELIGAWAIRESRRISRKTGKPMPDGEQMKLDT